MNCRCPVSFAGSYYAKLNSDCNLVVYCADDNDPRMPSPVGRNFALWATNTIIVPGELFLCARRTFDYVFSACSVRVC